MLGTIGDVIHDVVVIGADDIRYATDTDCVITHRRGGSAANVAATVARLAGRARFIGQTGEDSTGAWLREELAADGVEVAGRIGGRSGTVVAVVDRTGERTMLTDRGSSCELAPADPAWVEGLAHLHVPAYSLVRDPLASTTRELARCASRAGTSLSIDASSIAIIDAMGVDRFVALLASLAPRVVLCNEAEAELLASSDPATFGAELLVVKHGPRPTVVHGPRGVAVEVAVPELVTVHDTTGAGDAFAAGFLVALLAGSSPAEAAATGNRVAVELIAAQPGTA